MRQILLTKAAPWKQAGFMLHGLHRLLFITPHYLILRCSWPYWFSLTQASVTDCPHCIRSYLQTFPHFEPGKEMGYPVSCKVGLQNWNQVTKEWSCDSYPLRHSASCQGALRLCGPDLFAHSAGNQQPEPGLLVCFLLTYSHMQGSICFGPRCRQSITILLLLSRFALHQIHRFGITAAGQSF